MFGIFLSIKKKNRLSLLNRAANHVVAGAYVCVVAVTEWNNCMSHS